VHPHPDGEILGGLLRVPQGNEFRGNLAAGGKAVDGGINDRDREIVDGVLPMLRKHGLWFVGLDVIGGNLTEVNVTSPTCFREITDQTGFNVAGMFMDALEKQISATQKT
jgi:glutathione synthase